MSEAEVMTHIAMRAEFMWVLGQWWIGACIAMVVAAHLGTEHLSMKVTVLLLFLFTLYSVQTFASIQTQQRYIDAAYQDLEELASTSELGNIASVALTNSRQQESSVVPFSILVALLTYFSAIGFVVYRHVQYKNLLKREIEGT